MRSTLAVLVIGVGVVAVSMSSAIRPALSPQAAGQAAGHIAGQVPGQASPARVATVERSAPMSRSHSPSTRLLFNDPLRRPHAIAEAIVANIDGVPRGERIDVSTYWISSRRIARALVRAVHRGVHVHVILAGNDKARGFGTSRRLLRVLGRPGARATTPGSWGLWSDGAAPGSGGIMHQKSYLFSRVGDRRWVVMNGSYNSADTSDTATYALMWQVVDDKALYDAFGAIGRAQARQRTLRHPLRTASGSGWSAYFLPTADRPDADPVLRRLRSIPGRRGTVVRIAMYSMWGPRGEWLARRLAAMSRGGASITLVAGPTVDLRVRAILTGGGVRVLPGCFVDGTYTHAKDMTATWLAGRTRRFRTWVGSDNWTSQGTASDEAVLGVDGADGFAAFSRAFGLLTSRTDGTAPGACHPRQD